MITLPMRARLSHRERGRREMLSRPRLISFLVLLATPGLCTEPSRPQEPKTLFEEAERALTAGDYARAEKGFREVLKLEPRSAAAYSGLGVVYLRTEKINSAIKAFETAKRIAPQVVGIDLNLGLAFYKQQNFRHAIPHFGRVLEVRPQDVQPRYLKGMCHFMLDEYEPTVQTLEPLLAKEQNDLDFLFVLGIAYGKLKRTEQSSRTFAQLVRAGGDTAHMHLLLGKAYLDLYANQKARAELEKRSQAILSCRTPTSTWVCSISAWGCWSKRPRSSTRRSLSALKSPGATKTGASFTWTRATPRTPPECFAKPWKLIPRCRYRWAGSARSA